MENQGIGLVWIVVKDMKATLKFYVDILGFELAELYQSLKIKPYLSRVKAAAIQRS